MSPAKAGSWESPDWRLTQPLEILHKVLLTGLEPVLSHMAPKTFLPLHQSRVLRGGEAPPLHKNEGSIPGRTFDVVREFFMDKI